MDKRESMAFYIKAVPALVVLNFVFSCMMYYALQFFPEFKFNGIMILIISIVLITTMNGIVIITRRRKDEKFSAFKYAGIVLIVPCVLPLVLYGLVMLMGTVLSGLGVPYNIV